MNRLPALAALALLQVCFLSTGAGAQGGGTVRFWLRLPGTPSAEFVDTKLAQAEKSINSLIYQQRERLLVTSAISGRTALRISAYGWNAQVGKEARARKLQALRDAWGADIVIEESSAFAPANWPWALSTPVLQKGPVRSVNGTSVGKTLKKSVPKVLSTSAGGIFFDGGGSVWNGGSVVPGSESKAGEICCGAAGEKKSGGDLAVTPPAGKVKKEEPPAPGNKRLFFVGLPFENLIQQEAAAAGVDPAVIRAIVAAKSNFNPTRSGGGAYGLMMVSHGAAKTVGITGGDLNDPETNLRAGSRYFAWLLKRFNGDLHRALAAYQVGPGAVRKSGGLPNDKGVKYFLANFEKAYKRPVSQVKPVETVTPTQAIVRQVKETVDAAVHPDPKDPVKKWRPLIDKYAAKYAVDADLVESIMRAENPWGDPKRISSAGAVGLMQLMPATAKDYGVDPYNAEQNIKGGVRHIKVVLAALDGNMVLAVAGYNAGHGRVKRLGRVPNIRETVKYVTRVFNNYEALTGRDMNIHSYMTAWAQRYSDRVAV